MVTHDNQNMFLLGLLVSDLAIFLLVSSLLYFAMKHLFKLVVSDFEILSWMMQRIKLGTYRSDDIEKVSLEESKGAIRFIQYTAEELNNYQRKLKYESTTDELTTLYNRRVLNENLNDYLHMANAGKEVHLMIVDMDKFKAINDSYGHEAGDEVLKVFAHTLKHVSHDSDLCIRAGGDEFIVVLIDYDTDQIKQWYEDLHQLLNESSQALREKYKIPFEFGVSVGCTRIRNDDNRSAILKRADDALYQVKENGRNHIICV
jgi:diguanylate cyclase (GGDEF)-like protein